MKRNIIGIISSLGVVFCGSVLAESKIDVPSDPVAKYYLLEKSKDGAGAIMVMARRS